MLIYKTEPYKHQRRELEDYWNAEARALFWEMRTGKTKVVIDSAASLLRLGKVASLLVVAPKGPHDNWIRKELPKHCPVDWVGHAWSAQNLKSERHERSLDRTLRAASDPGRLAVLAINMENLLSETAVKAINALLRRGPVYLAVDESHHFGRPSSKRTNRIRALAKKCPYRRILTGKPTGNSPLRLFSQFEILEKGILGYTRYSDFKLRYSSWSVAVDPRSGRKYDKLDGYQNMRELRDRVARLTSSVMREECEDMPEIVQVTNYYAPTDKQIKTYRELGKNYETQIQGKDFTVADSGSRLIKMQQILSNFVIMPDLTIEKVDEKKNTRIESLIGLMDDIDKALVWCRFVEDIRLLRLALREAGIPHVEYYGATPDDERARSIDLFQDDPAMRVFLGQPSSGAGEGQDLSAADSVVWYSHTFNVVVRDQASARASIAGKKSVGLVDTVASPGGVDDYILRNLSKKRDVEKRVTGAELRKILKECEI